MKKKLFLFALSMVMVLSVFLTACGGGGKTADGGDDGDPVDGGTLNLSMFSAPAGKLHPVFSDNQYDTFITNYTFDYLMNPDENIDYNQPALAESMEWKDDTTLEIKLREGVKWHDGEEVTIDDLIFTYETLADPGYTKAGNTRFYLIEDVVGAKEKHDGKADKVKGLKKVDDYTLEMEFNHHYAPAISQLAPYGPLPEHIFADMDSEDMLNADEVKKNPIGYGPYKVKEHKANEYVVLEKNEDYYVEGKPHIDQIVWKVMNQDVAVGALQSGEVDAISMVDASNFDTLDKQDNIEVKETEDFGFQFMGFNLEVKKLQDKALRQAIAHGINREALVKGLLKEHGYVTNQWMAKPSWAYNKALDGAYPHDVEKAKKILADAGYEDKNGDGYVENPDGKKLSIKLDYPVGNPIREKSAPIIVENLKEIGIKVDLQNPREFAAYSNVLEQGKIEMYLLGFSTGTDPDSVAFYGKDGGFNYMNFNDKKNDELLKKGQQEPDQDKRTAIYKEWSEYVNEELPIVYLYGPNLIEAWNKDKLKGVTFDWRGAIEHDKFIDWWIPEDQQ